MSGGWHDQGRAFRRGAAGVAQGDIRHCRLCGAIVYVVMNNLGVADAASITLSIIVTLAIRLAAIRWGLSLPVFASKAKAVNNESEGKSED